MPLANYTTKVPVEQSIAEIQEMLVAAGAESISMHYDGGKITAIDFAVTIDKFPLGFRLPQNAAAAQKILVRQKAHARLKTLAHAEAVSWRILRDWVRAQLAMVELAQAEFAQVFMPYAMIAGESVYRQFREQRIKQLGDGSCG